MKARVLKMGQASPENQRTESSRTPIPLHDYHVGSTLRRQGRMQLGSVFKEFDEVGGMPRCESLLPRRLYQSHDIETRLT